jgi:hypothetical protein
MQMLTDCEVQKWKGRKEEKRKEKPANVRKKKTEHVPNLASFLCLLIGL